MTSQVREFRCFSGTRTDATLMITPRSGDSDFSSFCAMCSAAWQETMKVPVKLMSTTFLKTVAEDARPSVSIGVGATVPAQFKQT
jgi:hypothetical protein